MAHYDLSSLNVLVAEDNQFMRSLLVRMLARLGIGVVRHADNGADAFAALESFNADILFLDWLMAPLDGIELVRRIRLDAESPNPYVPVIMVTGYTELHRVIEARDAGIHEILVKPFSVKTLALRLESIIERPRPFIRTASYFGPDRRRRHDPGYRGPERRASARAAAEAREAIVLKDG